MKDRYEAMVWWSAMTYAQRQQACDQHKDLLLGERSFKSLTGREIEKLFTRIYGKPLTDLPNR